MGTSPARPTARTGRFAHDPATDAWEWDDEVFRIHGYQPGSVVPTTELVLGSKHPDDRDRIRALLRSVVETGDSFSVSYRLIGADEVERRVVLVGRGDARAEGRRSRIEGYYIDLTSDFEKARKRHAQLAVAASAEHRAVIEQAKGALMLAYGLNPDQAFAMLQWWSRNRNLKVRDLAQRVVVLAKGGRASETELRTALDNALHDLTKPASDHDG